jgi:diguanylate cyclase (GGDEF)-like protein/PAS domain S-box-containing protein
LGKPLPQVFNIVDSQSGQVVESPVQQVLHDGNTVAMSTGMQLIRPDGSQLAIEDSAAPLRDSRGQLFGVVMVFHDVTERFDAQQALNREHDLFEKTFNQSAVGMAHLSPSGKWTRVNQKLCDITGYDADELMRLSFQGITHPDDLGTDIVNIKRLLAKEMDIYRSEKRYIRKDGQEVWVAINVRVVWKDDGTPDFGVSVIEDIHSRKLAEQEATLAQKQYEALFEQMPEGVLLIDTDMQVAVHNREAMRQLGYSSQQMLNLHVWDFEVNHDLAAIEARKQKIMVTGRDDFESRYRMANGVVFDVAVSVQLMQLPGSVTVLQTLFRDITAQKQAALQIEHMAYHDQLTGLANRRLLHDRMNQAISSAARRQANLAVLFLDLDHFKLVNDSLGHPVGDELLLQVAQRLQACVRTGDTVARVGGDEFVLTLSDIAHADVAAVLAEKIINALSEPMQIQGEELRITPSIGISMCPQDGRDTDELLKHADAALYQAKKMGRANYQFYTKALNEQAQEHLQLERLLRKALEQQEFELYYQPQIDLRTGRLVGCEALIRWNHPGMGQVAPGRFIPIAENSDLINHIGRWVMHQACSQAKAWQDQGHDLKVSFNVSARQFLRPGELLNDLQSALACGANPQRMSIELTESLLMDAHKMEAVLQQIHATGVQLSLDDFGTGYSSLSYLRRFPIDVLKIDQSFVSHSDHNADDIEMVKTIIGMAHNLKMSLVAEGVETAEQSLMLAGLQCEVAQGYFFSKPVPVMKFDALLARQPGFSTQPLSDS